jgi:endonuclease/exonuclease/phosphatase family metal-dependent hydrolase
MRGLLVCIQVTSLLGCASSTPQSTTVRPRADLVVATYNVNFGLAGDPATLEAILKTGADVVLLQETTPAWEAVIRRTMSSRYRYIEFRHDRWPAGGMAFLSRHPLEQIVASPSPLGFFPAWRVVVKTPAGPVQLINLHLKPPVSKSGSYVSGYFTTPPEREREMKGHLALVKPDLPTMVLGDFNESSGGGLSVLKKRRYRDVLSTSSTPTWRWKVGPFTLRKQLDHIIYDPRQLECLGARVLDVGRSDHLPVVARFRVVRRDT